MFRSSPTSERLTYSHMVVQESLRLYPAGLDHPARRHQEDEIGGYRIPAGSTVLLSPYLTHRHPDFWENPEAFDPERFLPARSKGRPRHAYFPFGGGPRLCMGVDMAHDGDAADHGDGRAALPAAPGVVPPRGARVRPRHDARATAWSPAPAPAGRRGARADTATPLSLRACPLLPRRPCTAPPDLRSFGPQPTLNAENRRDIGDNAAAVRQAQVEDAMDSYGHFCRPALVPLLEGIGLDAST